MFTLFLNEFNFKTKSIKNIFVLTVIYFLSLTKLYSLEQVDIESECSKKTKRFSDIYQNSTDIFICSENDLCDMNLKQMFTLDLVELIYDHYNKDGNCDNNVDVISIYNEIIRDENIHLTNDSIIKGHNYVLKLLLVNISPKLLSKDKIIEIIKIIDNEENGSLVNDALTPGQRSLRIYKKGISLLKNRNWKELKVLIDENIKFEIISCDLWQLAKMVREADKYYSVDFINEKLENELQQNCKQNNPNQTLNAITLNRFFLKELLKNMSSKNYSQLQIIYNILISSGSKSLIYEAALTFLLRYNEYINIDNEKPNRYMFEALKVALTYLCKSQNVKNKNDSTFWLYECSKLKIDKMVLFYFNNRHIERLGDETSNRLLKLIYSYESFFYRVKDKKDNYSELKKYLRLNNFILIFYSSPGNPNRIQHIWVNKDGIQIRVKVGKFENELTMGIASINPVVWNGDYPVKLKQNINDEFYISSRDNEIAKIAIITNLNNFICLVPSSCKNFHGDWRNPIKGGIPVIKDIMAEAHYIMQTDKTNQKTNQDNFDLIFK